MSLLEEAISKKLTRERTPAKNIKRIDHNADYEFIWTNYDMNQNIAKYVWENLPNGLQSWNIERMLYFRGTLAGFMFKGQFYILPYSIRGAINPYGLPVAVKPIAYNGSAPGGDSSFFGETFELPVDNYGDENDKASAVLLYDAIPFSPTNKAPSRYFMNKIIIHEMCEVMSRININIVVSNKKIILRVPDSDTANIVRGELENAFDSDSPFVVVESPLETQEIQSSSDFNADELFNTLKNYDAIRCFMNGISSKTFGVEKKERLTTGELAGGEEEKELIYDLGWDMRKMFADECNKRFGLDIKVYKRTDFFETSDELNGNGLNADEEVAEEVVKDE